MIFNRLAIIDLSDLASQPMSSKEFGTELVFNGEIFNHAELREQLQKKGIKFFSNHSDTEVVLNGLSYYGKKFLNKMIGQFSLVFIDNKDGNILMARDRLGQKPLFTVLTILTYFLLQIYKLFLIFLKILTLILVQLINILNLM